MPYGDDKVVVETKILEETVKTFSIRSASSVKIKTYVVTPITCFDKEELNRQIVPKLKQNRLERLAGVRLYQTGRYK